MKSATNFKYTLRQFYYYANTLFFYGMRATGVNALAESTDYYWRGGVRKFAVSATSLIDFLEPISLDEGVYLESEETVPCQSPNRLIEDVMCISRGTYAVTLFTVLMLG